MAKQTYTIRLTKETVQELDRIAKNEARSRNSVIELAINRHLKELAKQSLQSA